MKHRNVHERRISCSGIYYRIILLYTLLILAGCGTDEKEIVIISTNDMHGRIEQFPKLATFVERVKAEHPNVILVDAGDFFTGNPHVDYAEERGKPIITLMNELGFSVSVLGNHECDYGQKILRKRINDAAFPVICANINSSRSELDTIPPYHMITVDGIKLCFFSLLQTVQGLPDANPDLYTGITFDDYRATAPRYKYLRQECDALIGLTHLGIEADSILATEMPELDMIIGGHTHTLLEEPKIVNNIMIGQAKYALKYAGITTLKFSGKKLIQCSYRSIDIDTITQLDPKMVDLVEQFHNKPEFRKVVGHTSRPLSHEGIAHVLTSAMRDTARSDFAFYNHGGIRINTLPEGDITMETLLRIEPFDNHIVIQDMTAEDIKALLINRFNARDQHSSSELTMAGGKFSIIQDDTGKAVDADIKDNSGKSLAKGNRYKVALNNYINAEYDFPGQGKGTHVEISIIDAVLAYLRKHPSL